MIKVIDNFLDIHDFQYILKVVDNMDYEWSLWRKANENSKEGQFHFAHTYIQESKLLKSLDDKIVYIIMKKVTELYKKTLYVVRARTNLFLKTETPTGLGYHRDTDDTKCDTVLLYLEDSDGYTQFKTGEKIESKANRVLIFPSTTEHQTLSHTNVVFRTNININFR